MTSFPRDLLPPATPMQRRPEAPALGSHRQIMWYHVFCVADGDTSKFEVRNIDDEVLATDADWERLCDWCGWFPSASGFTRPDKPARKLDVADDTIVLGTAKIRLAIPRRLDAPMSERPTPPAVGETRTIAGYEITAKICKGANGDRPIYYLRSASGEVLSVCYDVHWDLWCHTLGWYPLEGLTTEQPIPRELPVTVAKPPRPTGPHLLNRHHYKSRDEIPEPWIYCGRGTPLGNPFIAVKDDPEIRSTLVSDPNNPEHRSSVDPITRFRRYLWDRLEARDPLILRELGKITAEHGLVCSCAPRPCHVTVIIKAWKWAKGRSVLDGYRKTEGESDPDWATESESAPASPTTDMQTKVEIPVIERRDAPKNLDLFGVEP